MYHKIYEFCRAKNIGNVYQNSADKPTPRVEYLISILKEESIQFELDKFNPSSERREKKVTCYNIILKGKSNKMLVAHHDIVNPNIDNANDNSASVINAIMVKKLIPDINVVLLDGEEMGGLGSQRVSEQIKGGYFGNIDWVLNLELTGKGGKYFFIGDLPGNLTNHIKSIFDCPVISTPYNDSITFRKNGIDSVVINPLPPIENGLISNVKWCDGVYLDYDMLYNCHTSRDSIESISVNDMKEFVEEVLLKIVM